MCAADSTKYQAWANPGKSSQPTYKCGYSHIRKSENTDFYQYPQMFGDISQKFEDM